MTKNTASSIQTVGIIGAGQMGGGIAQVVAASGVKVKISDIDLAAAEKGKAGIAARLDKQVSRGKLEADARDTLLANIEAVAGIEAFASVDLVIEAASENLELKCKLFTQLDAICGPDTLFASNTSSISITLMAAVTQRPERFIGLHFFNPVPVMKLVEMIPGIATSDETLATTKAFIESLGKSAVVSRDKAGFIVNRILVPMINDACCSLDEGIASAEDIDTALTLGCNFPMGPLTLADFIGLDTLLAIMEVLQGEYGDKYIASPLLRRYVAAGWVGKKAGRGFFKYD